MSGPASVAVTDETRGIGEPISGDVAPRFRHRAITEKSPKNLFLYIFSFLFFSMQQ